MNNENINIGSDDDANDDNFPNDQKQRTMFDIDPDEYLKQYIVLLNPRIMRKVPLDITPPSELYAENHYLK